MREKDVEDRRWVELVLKNNDQAACARIVNKYRGALLQFISERIRSEAEAEDLLQEVFTRVFNNLHSFNPQYAFSTWLYNIAGHCCIDHLRKSGKTGGLTQTDRNTLWEEAVGKADPAHEEPEDTQVCLSVGEHAEEFMNLLPEKYRVVFSLRYIERLKYRQISEKTGLPIGTVKTYLFRTRAVLNAKAKKTDRNDA